MPSYSNSFYAYIENGKNDYPAKAAGPGSNPLEYITGYHRIPNQLFVNYLNPRQWFDMIYGNSAIRITGAECMISNMIPLTENPAIQGNATFTTFNNTIYAICYEDNKYETEWEEEPAPETFPWMWYREGLFTTASKRITLPIYKHGIWKDPKLDSTQAGSASQSRAFAWDPLINAEEIKELRPGKNAVKFSWSGGETRWMNTTGIMTFDPTWTPGELNKNAIYSQGIYDTKGMNISPHTSLNRWIYQADTGTNIAAALKKPALTTPGIFEHQWIKPIPHWFIKMVPLFDSANALIKTTAQVLITMTLHVETVPAKSATQFPNYGTIVVGSADNTDIPKTAWHFKQIGLQNKGILPMSFSEGTITPTVARKEDPRYHPYRPTRKEQLAEAMREDVSDQQA